MSNAAILISAEVGRLIVCWGALHSRHLCLAMCGPFAPCRSKEAGILCIFTAGTGSEERQWAYVIVGQLHADIALQPHTL